ncbi:hypothetical protein PAPYR_12254 [Paratrimastix pyriformis]|uniref:Uncharacterized protein n=1 Tax=Paratrimastix pyriformis TaxID=342808 RepID=A0ABQ8U261_9EUKA|nr:hypothetical protein PAPYR_12254 [Paratrimastix pyriformis]
MHPRVSHTGIEAPAKLAVSGCSSDIMCAVTPTPEGGSVLAYDRHPNTGTLADLHRWLSHEGDPLYIRMPLCQWVYISTGVCLPTHASAATMKGGAARRPCWPMVHCYTAAPRVGAFLGRACVLIMSLDLSWQTIHHHHHTLHQFDVFSGRNLCAHRVLVHQDIRLMPASHQHLQIGTTTPAPSSWGFAGGRCEAVHACIRID